jgi:hypothetical protein
MHVAHGLHREFAIDGPAFGHSVDGSEHFGLGAAITLNSAWADQKTVGFGSQADGRRFPMYYGTELTSNAALRRRAGIPALHPARQAGHPGMMSSQALLRKSIRPMGGRAASVASRKWLY